MANSRVAVAGGAGLLVLAAVVLVLGGGAREPAGNTASGASGASDTGDTGTTVAAEPGAAGSGDSRRDPAPDRGRRRAGQPPGTIRLPDGGTATLRRAELDAAGVLAVPDGVREATWWGVGLGSSAGATVLAGHVNWAGVTGPFAELWDTRIDDRVTVIDRSGTRYRYRVTDLVTVPKTDLPEHSADLFGQQGPHRLVLVTCGGGGDGDAPGATGAGDYTSNRIVTASLT